MLETKGDAEMFPGWIIHGPPAIVICIDFLRRL